ncbi:hypothetical protein ACTULT_004675, partial [Escherichia coli]|nr:hypothetical protein [Escherichia coli]EGE3019725.1 hypothetical protein [Escherichia coli]
KTGNNARNGGKNSLNRLIRCVCGKKIGPDPRNFNQRVNLGRNDLLIRTFPSSTNVIDLRGKDMGTYIDANGACWAPGTPSIIMYPGGSGPSYSMSSSTSSANSGS